MITLTQKQKVILRHIDGLSNRAIAKELQMSKDTVNKYINEYEHQKSELLLSKPDMARTELIQAIVEKPKYNSDGRKPIKVTPEIREFIENCIELNRKKRSDGRSKQVLKKIDIHEELLSKESVSYTHLTLPTKRIV